MGTEPSAGSFKISHAPLASLALGGEPEPDASELPSHYQTPLLLAIARNPRTLFVCWSVNWQSAFGRDLPVDRKAHVKLKFGDSARTHAVEPLSGHCSIGELSPGETYAVEIGYYAPADRWNVVASGHEITMMLEGQTDDEGAVDVATIPFHLEFQRLVDLLETGDAGNLARILAEFEERVTQDSWPSGKDEQLLSELGLSSDDLRRGADIREALARSTKRWQSGETFLGGSSPIGSSWAR